MTHKLFNALLGSAPPVVNLNWALTSNGSGVTGSDSILGGPLRTANGQRGLQGDYTNSAWGTTGDPNGTPQTLENTLVGTKTITEINVITMPDNLSSSAEPSLSDTFTLYGLTAYKVQSWNGSSYDDIPGVSVTGNNKVWRQFTGLNVTSSKFRLYMTGSVTTHAWVVEFELIGH